MFRNHFLRRSGSSLFLILKFTGLQSRQRLGYQITFFQFLLLYLSVVVSFSVVSVESYSTIQNMYSVFPLSYTYHSAKKDFKNVLNYNITGKKILSKMVFKYKLLAFWQAKLNYKIFLYSC